MTAALVTDPVPARAEAGELGRRVAGAVAEVIAGRQEQIDVVVGCVLAGGHVLIEDVPGVGKTLLAHAVAAALGGSFARVQGTADLLPGDVVGGLAPDGDGFGLHFRPGPVFANVVLFDELNRANPRTQSALLEVMEEQRVTVDGHPHPVPDPFVVVATQNPTEMAGTYTLAEGVTDRFMAAISLGRASTDEEVDVLTGRRGRNRLGSVPRVASLDDLRRARDAVATVHLAEGIAHYAVALLQATRTHHAVRIGASTRAGVAMVALAKAFAVMDQRDFVAPHDVGRAAAGALAHRIVTTDGSQRTAREVVAECLATVPAPRR